MPSTDNFIQSLADKKKVLDVNPYLDVSDQNGLELSYFLLRDSVDRTLPRQTSSRHRKAQQHLKNAYLIAKVLFVLVAATASITDLALLEHKELFPRLEQWWSDNLPTEKFESHAAKLLEDLETKRDKGELSSNRGRKRFRPSKRLSKGRRGSQKIDDPQHLRNEKSETVLLPRRESNLVETGTSLQVTLSTESATHENYTLNPIDEETIPFHSSQLITFLDAYQNEYPHIKTVCDLLRISEPNLQLPYSLFNLASPYLDIKLVLPPGIRVNIEVSREFSYLFVQYLWMLQGSLAIEEKSQ